jgi:hypothetical protein
LNVNRSREPGTGNRESWKAEPGSLKARKMERRIDGKAESWKAGKTDSWKAWKLERRIDGKLGS